MIKKGLVISLIASSFLFADEQKIDVGWNLLSVPWHYDELIPNANYMAEEYYYDYYEYLYETTVVWSYVNNSWQYRPESIKIGQGFWIKSDSSYVLDFGEDYDIELPATADKSWHLLGAGKDMTISDSSRTVWTYENGWNANPSVVKKGLGFWVKNAEESVPESLVVDFKEQREFSVGEIVSLSVEDSSLSYEAVIDGFGSVDVHKEDKTLLFMVPYLDGGSHSITIKASDRSKELSFSVIQTVKIDNPKEYAVEKIDSLKEDLISVSSDFSSDSGYSSVMSELSDVDNLISQLSESELQLLAQVIKNIDSEYSEAYSRNRDIVMCVGRGISLIARTAVLLGVPKVVEMYKDYKESGNYFGKLTTAIYLSKAYQSAVGYNELYNNVKKDCSVPKISYPKWNIIDEFESDLTNLDDELSSSKNYNTIGRTNKVNASFVEKEPQKVSFESIFKLEDDDVIDKLNSGKSLMDSLSSTVRSMLPTLILNIFDNWTSEWQEDREASDFSLVNISSSLVSGGKSGDVVTFGYSGKKDEDTPKSIAFTFELRDNEYEDSDIFVNASLSLKLCEEGYKEVDGECVPMTCRDDKYECPVCEEGEELKYNSDGSGYCEKIACEDGQKEVDGECVAKTCKEDGYNCSSGNWMADSGQEMTWYEAKEYCASQGGRLPTIEELKQAWIDDGSKTYPYKTAGFEDWHYWSSIEDSNDYAYYFNFYNGKKSWYNKFNDNSVRCVE